MKHQFALIYYGPDRPSDDSEDEWLRRRQWMGMKFPTLTAARAAAREAVGGWSQGKWYPSALDYVEAWRESRRPGCGGWIIRREIR